MANNREISQFASFLTVDESANNNVGIATTVRIAAGGLYVDGVEVIGPGGAWRGPNSGLVGAQGAQGAPGAQGDVGAQGTQGADGAQGNQGYQGRQGADGAQGNQGYQGRQGAPGAQGAQGAPAAGANGKVLQVVQVYKTGTFVTSSSSFTLVSGLSVNITPSSTSSKILIMANVPWSGFGQGNMALFRGSTKIYYGDAVGSSRIEAFAKAYWGADNRYSLEPQSAIYLDSPATTSSTNYNIKVMGVSGNTVAVGEQYDDSNSNERSRCASSIILMEIGA